MHTYLVGGAVRDSLLGLPPTDRDWLVVGGKPEIMLENGFHAVGKSFPVFLHPQTREEYALARIERKNSSGHTGFDCFFSADVTLEQDLRRRDLTINAMAMDESGLVYDPYNGQNDLKNRVLRHTSDAFIEDPLRVLRVARFKAQLAQFDFDIAPETLILMQQMSQNGELDTLTGERIWMEWSKALDSPRPDIFISTLQQCGALAKILPEIAALFGVPQSQKSHPEIDCGIHTLMVSRQAAQLSTDPLIRFAAQLHDLGKGVTPETDLPRHPLHEQRGIPLIESLCKRLAIPTAYRRFAQSVCLYHTHVHAIRDNPPEATLELFYHFNVWKNSETFEAFLLCCYADHLGRAGYENSPYPQKEICLKHLQLCLAVKTQDVISPGMNGLDIKNALYQTRLNALLNE